MRKRKLDILDLENEEIDIKKFKFERNPNQFKVFIQNNRSNRGNFKNISKEYQKYKIENNITTTKSATYKHKKRKQIKRNFVEEKENNDFQLFKYLSIKISLGGSKAYELYRLRDFNKIGSKRAKIKRFQYGVPINTIPSNKDLSIFEKKCFDDSVKNGEIYQLTVKKPEVIKIGEINHLKELCAKISVIRDDIKVNDLLNLIGGGVVSYEVINSRSMKVAFSNKQTLLKAKSIFSCNGLARFYCYSNDIDSFGIGILYNLHKTLKSKILEYLSTKKITLTTDCSCTLVLMGDGAGKYFWSAIASKVDGELSEMKPMVIPLIKSKGSEIDIPKKCSEKVGIELSGIKEENITLENNITIKVKIKGFSSDNKFLRIFLDRKLGYLNYPVSSSRIKYEEMGFLLRKNGVLTFKDYCDEYTTMMDKILDCIKAQRENFIGHKWLQEVFKYYEPMHLDLKGVPHILKGTQFDVTLKTKYNIPRRSSIFKMGKTEGIKYFKKNNFSLNDKFIFVNYFPRIVSEQGKLDLKGTFNYPKRFKGLYLSSRFNFCDFSFNDDLKNDETINSEYGHNISHLIQDDSIIIEEAISVGDFIDGKESCPCLIYIYDSRLEPERMKILCPKLHMEQKIGIGTGSIIHKELMNRKKTEGNVFEAMSKLCQTASLKSYEVKDILMGLTLEEKQKKNVGEDIYNILYVLKMLLKLNQKKNLEESSKKLLCCISTFFLAICDLIFQKYEKKINKIKKNSRKNKILVDKNLWNTASFDISKVNTSFCLCMTKDDLPSTIQSLLRIPSSATNSHSISELPYEYPPLFYKIRVRDGSLKIIKNSLIDNKEVEVNSTEFKNKKKYLWLLSDSCDLLLCEEVFITEKNRFIKHRDLCNSKNQEGFTKHGGQILICENFIFVDDQSGFVLNRKNRIRSTVNPYISIISHLFSNIFKKPVIYRSTEGSENYNIIEREIFELEQITSKIKIKTEDDSNMLDNESDESECLLTDDEIPEILKNFKLDDDVIFSTLCYNCFDTLGNLLLQKDFDQNISSDERMEKHARDNLLALLQTNWKKNVWVKLFNYFRTKKLESINYVSKAAPLVVLKNIILTKKYLNNNFVFDKNKYLIFKGLDDCLFINRNSILLKLTNEEADNNNSIFFGIEEKIIDENFMEYKNIRETEIHVYLRNIKLSEKKKKNFGYNKNKKTFKRKNSTKKTNF